MTFRILWALTLLLPSLAAAQGVELPLRQSRLDPSAADPSYLVPLDSTADSQWLGGGPITARWDIPGEWAYFQYDTSSIASVGNHNQTPWWRVSADGSRVEPVTAEAARELPGYHVAYTRSRDRAVYFHQNELRYWKRGESGARLLLSRQSPISPSWSSDEREIRFAEGNTIYSLDPESGLIRQLTRTINPQPPAQKDPISAELERQQLEIFDFVREQKASRDSFHLRTRREAIQGPRPIAILSSQGERTSHLQLSPGDRYVTFMSWAPVQNKSTIFVDYVNQSGYVNHSPTRPKVGETLEQKRVGIISAEQDGIPDDSIRVTWVETEELGKPVTATNILWNQQGTRLVVEFQSIDYKDSWILLVDPETGEVVRILDHQHDPAWLGGPGPTPGRHMGGWITFLPGGEEIAVVHEESGWAHLYLIDMRGRKRALTSGEWEIRDIALISGGREFLIAASKEHPAEVHLYTLPAKGGKLQRIDRLGEGQVVVGLGRPLRDLISSDNAAILYIYGKPDELDDLYIQPLKPGANAVRVTRSGTDAFYRIPWVRSEFVQFLDEKGKPVWMRTYLPPEQHPKRPAVMELHGAGYAQAVHKRFGHSSSHGGPLYAQYLAQRGFVYVVIDYMGSAGYGRDTRTAIYRSMGDRDVASLVSALPVLEARYGVDRGRVGLYGCSYGGFLTLMALFKEPGTFAAGVAQCAVTDWAHYNHSYTARILNGTPTEDREAYITSSPIWHAEGLQDALIIQHGLMDWNVHYQDAVRLAQRLMELGKDFELVTYPIEEHSWNHRSSQIDSAKRMTRLWERVLLGERSDDLLGWRRYGESAPE